MVDRRSPQVFPLPFLLIFPASTCGLPSSSRQSVSALRRTSRLYTTHNHVLLRGFEIADLPWTRLVLLLLVVASCLSFSFIANLCVPPDAMSSSDNFHIRDDSGAVDAFERGLFRASSSTLLLATPPPFNLTPLFVPSPTDYPRSQLMLPAASKHRPHLPDNDTVSTGTACLS